jgi:Tol biopolymer transport system component
MLDATFAPDGRSIIYRTSQQTNGTISAIDVDGKHRRKLLDTHSLFTVSPLLR